MGTHNKKQAHKLVIIILFIGLFFVGSSRILNGEEIYISHDPKDGPLPGFSFIYDTVENNALAKLRDNDSKIITIREAALFHRMIMDRCFHAYQTFDPLEEKRELHSRSPLREVRPRSLVVEGDSGVTSSLYWDIVSPKKFVIFNFWISTKRTNRSMLDVTIEGRKLFINISHVTENQSVDKKLPELDNKSVREFLSPLKSKASKEDTKKQPRGR